ncbi:uncharacterized protein H6S33_007783 [Morchella sextelata]|uniref:uncharacterized protein n=1 Tax=Morchella sextelata TaxID=1174677 RepID=UPI001D055D0D|nr:uncharacterized protein H6S33_007783 [Morchella sextelata]KAH0603461.1 hypothetical protein H6S33_007783 [Morchella sextelata]
MKGDRNGTGESQDAGIGSRYAAQRSMIFSSGPIAAIMLAGKTGAGKSSLIKLLGGRDAEGNEPVSDGGLESCTKKTTTYITKHNGRTVLLLDTPGFDDSAVDNLVILNDIVSNLYMWALQDKDVHTHGVLFLHDISETRFGGSQQKTLQLLKSMCGPEAMGNVIIGTTMWFDKGAKYESQVKRESEFLMKYWEGIHKTVRVPEGDEEVANAIIGDLLARPPTKLLVQTELLRPPHTCEATTVGRIAIPEGKREAERLAKEMEEQKEEFVRIEKEKEREREKERQEEHRRYLEEQERNRKEMVEEQERNRREIEERLMEEQKKNAKEQKEREEAQQKHLKELEQKQKKEMEDRLKEEQKKNAKEQKEREEAQQKHLKELEQKQKKEMEDRLKEEQKKNAKEQKEREEAQRKKLEELAEKQRKEMEEYAEKQRKKMEDFEREQEKERKRVEKERADAIRRKEEEIAEIQRKADEAVKNAQNESSGWWCSIM